MNLVRSIVDKFRRQPEVILSPLEKLQKEHEVLINIINGRASLPEQSELRQEAIKKIVDLGERGRELVVQSVLSGRMNSLFAIDVLDKFGVEQRLDALNKLVSARMLDRGSERAGINRALEILLEIKDPKSSGAIAERAGYILSRINIYLEVGFMPAEYLVSSRFRTDFADLNYTLRTLSNFPGPEAKQATDRLYKQLSKIQKKILEIKNVERQHITEGKTIYDYQGSETYNMERKKLITAWQSDPIGPSSFASKLFCREQMDEGLEKEYGELKLKFKEKILWPIYEGALGGSINSSVTLKLLESFDDQKKVLPIYLSLLDYRGYHDAFFLSGFGKLLELIATIDPPDFSKIVAQAAVDSARFATSSSRESQEIIRGSTNFKIAVDYLKKAKDGQIYINKLNFAFPELFSSATGISPRVFKEENLETEKEALSHSKVFIKGNALIAELLGKNKDKVSVVDIYMTRESSDSRPDTSIPIIFQRLEDLKKVLSPAESENLSQWVGKNSYGHCRFNVVCTTEEAMALDELFIGEPKLLISSDDDLKKTKTNGQQIGTPVHQKVSPLLINEKLPPNLISSGNIYKALKLMELGTEFGFSPDLGILKQAEDEIREGKLVISTVDMSRVVSEPHELTATLFTVGPEFIGTLIHNKKLLKSLITQFPRLGQLAESVMEVGGIEKYIEKKYGEVYLRARGYVRIYDVAMPDSKAAEYTKRYFLDSWYDAIQAKTFELTSAPKLLSAVARLPKPLGFEDVIQKPMYEEALLLRKTRDLFLDKLAGEYNFEVLGTNPEELLSKLKNFFALKGMELPVSLSDDKKKITQTLIKHGMHPKNPVLQQFDQSKKDEIKLVISAEPFDIMQSSTDKPWHSCACLYGSGHPKCKSSGQCHYQFSTYGDVACGSVIAYVMEGNKFVARVMVREGFTLAGNMPAAAVEKVYGDERFSGFIHQAVRAVLKQNDIKIDTPMETYAFPEKYKTYFDLVSDGMQRWANGQSRRYYTDKK